MNVIYNQLFTLPGFLLLISLLFLLNSRYIYGQMRAGSGWSHASFSTQMALIGNFMVGALLLEAASISASKDEWVGRIGLGLFIIFAFYIIILAIKSCERIQPRSTHRNCHT